MLLRKLIEIGAKGNPRAIDQVLRQYAAAQAVAVARQESTASEQVHDITDADAASLALMRDMLRAEIVAGEGGAP